MSNFSLTIVFINHLLQLGIKLVSRKQLFQRHGHPVAPIMFGVGRYVNAFGLRVFAAQGRVHAGPIL